MNNRRYCPNCDNKEPEFETVFIYRVYIRNLRGSNNRLEAIGWFCKRCGLFEISQK